MSKFKSNPGDPIKVTLGLHYDKKGCIDLVPKGKYSLYDEIQSHADSCDIHVILKRFAAGDTSVLQQRAGAFADVSNLPTNFAEILNTVCAAEDIFGSLPSEVRNNFGNSVAQFLASMDSPEFTTMLQTAQEPIVNAAPASVVEGETSSSVSSVEA